jgi:hypothetical protein
MVIMATPAFLISAVTHAIIDRSKLLTAILGITVSFLTSNK